MPCFTQGSYSAALDLKTPLIAICVSGVMNAVLDCLFIFQFQWGLFGAALATVIAQYVGGGMLVYQVKRVYVN
jgi:Na+-driven multidrug efflux pump